MKSRPTAFTLVELLVVIAIIGILVALLLPAVQAAREAARRMQCTNHLKQLSLAALNYESTKKELPAARLGCDSEAACADMPNTGNIAANTKLRSQGASVFVQLLPFMEQQALYDSLNVENVTLWGFDNYWLSDPKVMAAVATPIDALKCPSDGTMLPYSQFVHAHATTDALKAATSSYAGVAGDVGPPNGNDVLGRLDPRGKIYDLKYNNTGVFFYHRNIKLREITDGTSNTLFFGETVDGHARQAEDGTNDLLASNIWTNGNRCNSSMRTTKNPLNSIPEVAESLKENSGGQRTHGGFNSRHPGGANFAKGDGSVDYLTDDVDPKLYRAQSTRSASADDYASSVPSGPGPR